MQIDTKLSVIKLGKGLFCTTKISSYFQYCDQAETKKHHMTKRELTKNSKERFNIPTEADAMAETHRREENIHNRQEILINENTRNLK